MVDSSKKSLSSRIVACAALSLAIQSSLFACKKTVADEPSSEEEVTSTSGGGGSSSNNSLNPGVPQVGSIVLTGLGTGESTQASLTAGESDCRQDELGVFGMALGGACHTAPLGAKLMLGNTTGDFDGDGDADCADLDAAKVSQASGGPGPGILMHLVCGDVFKQTPNVKSLAFENQKDGGGTEALSISFADFTGRGVGSWTAGNSASYPANIRLWVGDTLSNLGGIFAMDLESRDKGTLYLARLGNPGESGAAFSGKISFANATGTACASAPSASSCNFQQIKFYGGEGDVVDGPPNSFNLRIFADSKTAPTFMALEGRYRYSEAVANRTWGDGTPSAATGLRNIREIYFRAVQKSGQIWGRFIFRKGDGTTVDTYMATDDIKNTISSVAGVCQNLGSSATVACTEIEYTDYDSLWVGETNMENLTSSPVDIDWTGAPDKEQLCTTVGCVGR